MYRVIKVLNNNGILVLDGESNSEIIFIGNGVGFGRKPGERMKTVNHAKRYELVTGKVSALQQVNNIDPVFIEAAGRIIEEAEVITGPLNKDILIPLADHIAMAASRARNKMELPNPFNQDIKALFSEEYQAATKSVTIIQGLTGICITEDEIGYITLHIHAGLSEEDVAAAMDIARLVNESVQRIEQGMNIKLHSDSLGYNRLVSHIRYMIARTQKGERTNLDLDEYAKTNFPDAYKVAGTVCHDIGLRLGLTVAPEETGFLTVHIQRVLQL